MNIINSRTVYTYNGKDYNKLSDIQTEIEDGFGSIIDKSNAILNARQRLALLEALKNNAGDLVAIALGQLELNQLLED